MRGKRVLDCISCVIEMQSRLVTEDRGRWVTVVL